MNQNHTVPEHQDKVVSQETGSAQGGKKTMWIAGGVVVIVLLLVGGYVAYAQYASPAKVWQKFAAAPISPKIVTETSDFSYVDKGKLTGEAAKNPLAAMFSNIKFSTSGTGYINTTDAANPEMSMDLTYSFGSGDTSISSKANMIMKGQDIYINFGDNPLINSLLSAANSGQPVTWIKINPKDMEAASQSASSTLAVPNYAQDIKDDQAIAQKYSGKVLIMDKYLGRETVRGVSTFHFSNSLDKTQAKAMVGELLDTIINQASLQASSSPAVLAQAKDNITKILDSVIDNLQISDFETWIGADLQLHKLKLVSNAPSLTSLAAASANNPALSQNPATAVDNVLSAMTFDGVININQEYYDFGKTQTVTAPDNALDVAQKLKELNAKSSQLVVPGQGSVTMPIVPSGAETVYLYYPGSAIRNGISLEVTNLTSSQLTMTVTNTASGQSQAISLKIGGFTTLYGYKMTLAGIKQVNTGTVAGQPSHMSQAALNLIKQ